MQYRILQKGSQFLGWECLTPPPIFNRLRVAIRGSGHQSGAFQPNENGALHACSIQRTVSTVGRLLCLLNVVRVQFNVVNWTRYYPCFYSQSITHMSLRVRGSYSSTSAHQLKIRHQFLKRGRLKSAFAMNDWGSDRCVDTNSSIPR